MKKLILIIACLGAQANATKYTYFPDSHLYMGSGMDLFRPDTAFPDCVEYDGVVPAHHDDGSTGSNNSRVALKLIQTRDDFYKFINFSASMGGSYKFFSGSASYRFEEENKFHSDSLSWAVVFETNYGIYKLKNPRLKNEYRRLPADRLHMRCGSEVTLKTRKAVSLVALFTLKNLEESHRREISAQTNLSFSGVAWDANMQASYTSILRTAMARSQMELEVYAVGGQGIVRLKDLATTGSVPGETPFDVFSRVPRIMADYIGSLNESVAAPVEFVTGDMASLTEDIGQETDSLRARQLGRLFVAYLDLEAQDGRIKRILNSERDRYDLTADQENELSATRGQLNDSMNKVEAAALQCKEKNESCRVPEISQPVIKWPAPRFSRCENERRIALFANCISEHEAALSRMKNEVPACIQESVGGPYKLYGWAPCRD